MNYLIFCSAEIGGLSFHFAKVLNDSGHRTYFVSLSGKKTGHDTSTYHYGNGQYDWDISHEFALLNIFSHRLDQLIYPSALIKQKLKKIVKKYKIGGIFATGIKSYLLSSAGLKYRYWSYGSDLDKFCFQYPYDGEKSIADPLKRLLFSLIIKRNARRTIKEASSVMIAPYQEQYLKLVSPNQTTFFLPHLITTDDPDNILACKQKMMREKLKQFSCDELFFSSTRNEWAGRLKSHDDNKGNNIIILAFHNYLKLQNVKKAKLLLVEKGYDVDETKKLIAQIGISDRVIWVPEMPRPQLDQYYLAAQFAFGQFHTPVITNSCIEPLAFATPAISYYGHAPISTAYYDQLPPILNSKDPSEIAEHLFQTSMDDNKYKELQLDSLRWVKKQCAPNAFTNKFLKLFNQ